jgi:ribosomal protein S18 acetylase RimI-like enzyme
MIRRAMPDDVPGIRLLMESVPGFWQSHWSNSTVALAIAGDLAFVEDSGEEGSRILGFVCAHDLGFRAYLSELVVAPSTRDQGIGRALVQKLEQELSERGQTILIADVWRDALPFYGALGWEAPEAVLLRKRLKSRNPGGAE